MKWIERKFEFNFPIGIFPCIVERLRGTPARLEELIRSIPPHILILRTNGVWSIQEHAGHLYDLDELHESRIDDFLSHAKMWRAADIRNKKTEAAKHNEKAIGDVLEQFREARKKFVGRLEQLQEEDLRRVAIHPRLQQPMRPIDMAFFVAEHDDHHLARITELARLLTSKP